MTGLGARRMARPLLMIVGAIPGLGLTDWTKARKTQLE